MFKIKKKKEKKEKDIEYYKKGFIRSQAEIVILFVMLLVVVFGNYNYLIFKYLIGSHYVYTEDLDNIYSQELNIDTHNYYKYFDEVAIQLFVEKIHDTNNDVFTELYHFGEYDFVKDFMKKEAEFTKYKTLGYNKDKETGCLTITNFSWASRRNVMKSVKDMKNCSTLIIDLRNNTGGTVGDARKISELFLDKGDIIYSAKTRTKEKKYVNKGDKKLSPEKILILQNENTASASEIFIEALKENLDNVTIVGTKSYGKGIGQYEHFLIKGFGVKATSELFFTPSGKSINGVGIKPDIQSDDPVKYVKEHYPYTKTQK